VWNLFSARLVALASTHMQGAAETWTTLWDAIVSSVVVTSVREFFGDVWGNIFPSVVDMAQGLRKGFVVASGRAWGEAILHFLTELAGRLRRCVLEKSLSPLWGVTWDPLLWCDEVRSTM